MIDFLQEIQQSDSILGDCLIRQHINEIGDADIIAPFDKPLS